MANVREIELPAPPGSSRRLVTRSPPLRRTCRPPPPHPPPPPPRESAARRDCPVRSRHTDLHTGRGTQLSPARRASRKSVWWWWWWAGGGGGGAVAGDSPAEEALNVAVVGRVALALSLLVLSVLRPPDSQAVGWLLKSRHRSSNFKCHPLLPKKRHPATPASHEKPHTWALATPPT
jgi:hypothetical protein